MEKYWSVALGFTSLLRAIKTKIHSELGQSLLKNLSPLGSRKLILAEQNFICQSLVYISKISRVRFDILEDISKILEIPQVLDFKQLQKVKGVCSLSAELKARWDDLEDLEKEDLQDLGKSIANLSAMDDLLFSFQKIFDTNGNVKETASGKLSQICARIRSLDSQINSLLESRYLTSQQDFITCQGGRVLLLTSAARTLTGVVHGRSASRSSVYIEPAEVVSQNNLLRDLREQKLQEINKILKSFSQDVFARSVQLLQNQAILAKLDFYFGVAEFSRDLQAGRVDVVEQARLRFKKAYHPLLKLDAERECVPFSAELGGDYTYLVVSGANAGGKSVFLKSVGLLCLMVNCGLLIPAEPESQVGVIDKYFVGIGDMQSLDSSLSSFSGYLSQLKKALCSCDERSLVLFDELGSYTDPEQGFALGASALESLCTSGSIGVISTHLNKLKLFAHHNPHCQNASMSFDQNTHNPTFHLQVGYPSDSHALELATNLHFSPTILARAKQLLDDDALIFSTLLSDLGKEKTAWQEKNQKLKKELKEAENTKKDYAGKLDSLQNNEKKIKKEQLAKAKQYFENLQAKFSLVLKEAKKNKNAQKLFKESAKVVEKICQQEFAEDKPLDFVKVGDTVFVQNFAENGKVLEADGSKVKVEVGGLTVSCYLQNLYSPREAKKKKQIQRQQVLISASVSRELKLLGKNFLEAKTEIDRFVDDALLAGLDVVRIVHGKGVLAGKVRKYLRERSIKYTIPPEKFGGDGVSEVML